MSDHFIFEAGYWLLIAALCYALWISTRALRFRNDLREWRNDLEDLAEARGVQDHPSHQEIRWLMDTLIDLAPQLGPWLIEPPSDEPAQDIAPTGDPIYDAAMERTGERVVVRLVTYILIETLRGWRMRLLHPARWRALAATIDLTSIGRQLHQAPTPRARSRQVAR